jgi:hypothetical protein
MSVEKPVRTANPSVPPTGGGATPPSGQVGVKKYTVSAENARVFKKDKDGVLRVTPTLSLSRGIIITGIPVKELVMTRKHGVKTGEFIKFSTVKRDISGYVHIKTVAVTFSKAEGEGVEAAQGGGAAPSTPATTVTAPVKAPVAPVATPAVAKSAIDAIKEMASDKAILSGAGVGAGLGFVVALLSGGNKIGTALMGAAIGGGVVYYHSSGAKISADGQADTNRLYADGKHKKNHSANRATAGCVKCCGTSGVSCPDCDCQTNAPKVS